MNKYQKAELNVLKEVIKILDSHKLTYYAIGGTCIGAIRHQGFIPWDDDIDIAMPRQDYESFKKICQNELPGYLRLLDYDNTVTNNFLFLKIHDIRTTMIDTYAKDDVTRYTGAFIDIMPLDGLPNDKELAIKTIKHYNKYIRLNNIIRGANNNLMLRFVGKLLRYIRKYNYYTTRFYLESSKFKFGSSDYISFTWRPEKDLGLKRVLFNYKDFEKTKSVKFEDIMINVPVGYDNYLSQDFGDYMTIPPENQRNSGHERYIYDIEKPYSYYVKQVKGD